MLFDRTLTVLVISPQPWDSLEVSKHHYARELACLGHRVVFVDPPLLSPGPIGTFLAPTSVDGIERLSYRHWFPYVLKFHARWLFEKLMRVQARMIARAIGATPDLVWDFDNATQFADLSWFGGKLKIFHPMDDIPMGHTSKGSDVVLSVSRSFIDRISKLPEHVAVIPHGIAQEHETYARTVVSSSFEDPGTRTRRVGYVGNLDHSGIDWPTLLRVADELPDVELMFYGPYSSDICPVLDLRRRANVKLLGRKTKQEILADSRQIDAWLVCYDPKTSVNGATNSHKILEYMATGKVVVSNHIEAYRDSSLLVMSANTSNEDFPAKLGQVMANLDKYNSQEAMRQRAVQALQHTYSANIIRIDDVLSSAIPSGSKFEPDRKSIVSAI